MGKHGCFGGSISISGLCNRRCDNACSQVAGSTGGAAGEVKCPGTPAVLPGAAVTANALPLWGGHADNSPLPSDSVPQSPMLRFIGGLAGPSAAAAGFLADPLGNMAGRERSCGSSQASEDGRGVPLRAGSGQSASGEPGGGGGGFMTGPIASQMQSRSGASAGLRRGGLPVRAGI